MLKLSKLHRGALPLVTSLASVAVSALALAAAGTTRDGAFTAEQAARGKAVYEKSCVNCHQPDFYAERLARYEDRPVSELFQTVSTTMPADNVGGLLTSEYVDVLAYIFSITGSPAGGHELTMDTIEEIRIKNSK